jgi:hypothetical protein
MPTLDEMRAARDAKIAAMDREIAIAAVLPIVPNAVQLNLGSRPWVTYRRSTLWEAMELFDLFPQIVNMEDRKNGSMRTVGPADPKTAGYELKGNYFTALRVHQGRGFGPSVDFYFYVPLNDGTQARVRVDLGDKSSFGASPVVRYGQADRVESLLFIPNPILRKCADDHIKYGGGGQIDESADFLYLFAADDDDQCSSFDIARANITTASHELD